MSQTYPSHGLVGVTTEATATFTAVRGEPRRGHNPRTDDRVEVASKHVAYFKPGKELKELINQNPG